MRIWWVNQGRRHGYEHPGGLVETDLESKAWHRILIKEFHPSDLLVCYIDGSITHVAVVKTKAVPVAETPRWKCDVEYRKLDTPILKSAFEAKRYNSRKYGPFDKNGDVNQAYICRPSADFVLHLAKINTQFATMCGIEIADDFSALISNLIGAEEEEVEKDIKANPTIPETRKQELIFARRGQGLFRRLLLNSEKACRLSNVSEAAHLRASHILPWADCETDDQRLDACNGLLFSPNFDHLFDRGYISFEDNGLLLCSPKLSDEMKVLLHLPKTQHSTALPFDDRRKKYLRLHRQRHGFESP